MDLMIFFLIVILTAEELTGNFHEELYGDGTSDETTSSSEVL